MMSFGGVLQLKKGNRKSKKTKVRTKEITESADGSDEEAESDESEEEGIGRRMGSNTPERNLESNASAHETSARKRCKAQKGIKSEKDGRIGKHCIQPWSTADCKGACSEWMPGEMLRTNKSDWERH